ncbi:3,4-dihydroxy-2-butanone-4-phosphate synthase [Thermaurantiacus tibetensis]|uniref:3,4-dihydroxy-2-butanone-4-phosphate synthase n=1 Tax=Thermaurantiacus tibetensis TaxID=2759035 RepID=UPI001890A6C0|nr:3,4-dihydroxy-2-butanone-4-phosphate synthase [Thermaurantiacus tibetensis]
MATAILDRIRAHVRATGMSRAAVARAAGLHPNSLRQLASPAWNPTAETIAKLEAFLDQAAASPLVGIETIIDEARNGRMFILVDDEDRENEGDLVIPAQMATPEAINFMARHGRGLICLALTRARVEQLGLPMMAPANGSRHETAFTISIEARHGVSTGISAADRARTIAVAIDAAQGPEALVSPGHVFPLVARDGGVLVRAGHTEASVDIARLAGLNPSGVICEIMNDDGTMARLADLIPFARTHGLKIGTIRDLIAYRRRHDNLVACIAETRLVSRHGGEWQVKTYINKAEYAEHLVLQKGRVDPARPTLVRMHVLSPFADILGEDGPRTGALQRSMEIIGEAGAGIVVIIRDNRPDRLSRMIAAREAGVQEPLEQRDYGIGAQILVDLGVREIELLSNAHRSFVGLSGYGLEVVAERRID